MYTPGYTTRRTDTRDAPTCDLCVQTSVLVKPGASLCDTCVHLGPIEDEGGEYGGLSEFEFRFCEYPDVIMDNKSEYPFFAWMSHGCIGLTVNVVTECKYYQRRELEEETDVDTHGS